jgi:hypothetical protein
MNAEPAAAPGVTGESQTSANVASPGPQDRSGEQQTHSEPVDDRAPELEMLELMDVPKEILDRARAKVEKQQPQHQEQQSTAPQQGTELTEEQRRNTDPKLLARIDALTGKIKGELEPQVAEKDAEIKRLTALLEKQPGEKTPPAAPADQPARSGNPYENLKTMEALDEHLRIAEQIHDWAILNLDGAFGIEVGEGDSKETKDFTPQEVREMLVKANHAIAKQIPARRIQIQQEGQQAAAQVKAEELRPGWERHVETKHPELRDPESDMSKWTSQTLEQFPALKTAINGRWIAATLARAAIEQQEELIAAGLLPAQAARAAAAPSSSVDPKLQPFLAPKPKRAPAVPSAARGTPPAPGADTSVKEARAKYLASSQTDEDYADYVEALSEAQGGGGVGLAMV